MIENLSHIIRFTPVDDNEVPIYDEWLVMIDNLNMILQWRDHWKIQRMTVEEKQSLENRIAERFPEHKWFSQYVAYSDQQSSSPTTIWSTSEEEAKELFDRMNINNNKIKRI